MRLSIRNQILIPLIAIQAVAVTAITLATATLAARRSEREIVARLNGVIDTLGHANFPYTASVLARMRGLSGAHFVAYTEDGRVTEASLPAPRRALRRPCGPSGRRRASTRSASRRRPSSGRHPLLRRAAPRVGGPRDTSLLVLYPETSWRQARWEAAMPPLVARRSARSA